MLGLAGRTRFHSTLTLIVRAAATLTVAFPERTREFGERLISLWPRREEQSLVAPLIAQLGASSPAEGAALAQAVTAQDAPAIVRAEAEVFGALAATDALTAMEWAEAKFDAAADEVCERISYALVGILADVDDASIRDRAMHLIGHYAKRNARAGVKLSAACDRIGGRDPGKALDVLLSIIDDLGGDALYMARHAIRRIACAGGQESVERICLDLEERPHPVQVAVVMALGKTPHRDSLYRFLDPNSGVSEDIRLRIHRQLRVISATAQGLPISFLDI